MFLEVNGNAAHLVNGDIRPQRIRLHMREEAEGVDLEQMVRQGSYKQINFQTHNDR